MRRYARGRWAGSRLFSAGIPGHFMRWRTVPSMPTKRKPAPPSGPGAAGKRLWRSIVNDVAPDWELDAKDLALLAESCKPADTLDKLEKAVKREASAGRVTCEPAPGRRVAGSAPSR